MSLDRLIARGIVPRPPFQTCPGCELPRSCRDARHCCGQSPAPAPARFYMRDGMIFDRATNVHLHTNGTEGTQHLYTLLTELSSGGSL